VAAVFSSVRVAKPDAVLLSSHLGWTSRGGPGWIPFADVGSILPSIRMTRKLTIDLEDFRRRRACVRPRLVVFVYYFGAPAPDLGDAVALAREYRSLVLEDEAHALLSDLIGRSCGRLGDACIHSLHKMLPVRAGGMLVVNEKLPASTLVNDPAVAGEFDSWTFDLARIAGRRKQLSERFLGWIHSVLPAFVRPLWNIWNKGAIAQSMPFVVMAGSRDRFRANLNRRGFGVISLCHTLSSHVSPSEFADSHWLSRHIINFPTHQDVDSDALMSMQQAIMEWNDGD
jgi:dTDP-4-amino-4,6-dideoxygalactose transaminase